MASLLGATAVTSAQADEPAKKSTPDATPPAKKEPPAEEPPAPPTPEEDPAVISGIERPERYAGDTGRDVGEVFLFVPRKVTEFLLWSSSVAIGVLERQPVVPRVQDAVSSAGGRFAVLPTAFAETNGTFNIGARMIADFDTVATGFRIGFGGVDSFEVEPRIAFELDWPVRSLLSFELLYKRDDDLIWLGVGQDPENDPRNAFKPRHEGDETEYFEERTRFIASYGLRLATSFELLLSGSLDRRTTSDAETGGFTLSEVFERGSIPGAHETHWFAYVESAARLDTRPTRGRPSPGFLAETYLGSGQELIREASAQLVRVGGRVAGFIPLYRSTNILGLRLVADGVVPVGSVPLPFTELAGEPDFRGEDTHRDNIAFVASIDYRWLLHDRLAASIFFDTTTVAPSFGHIPFDPLRWVVGTALDLHSDEAEIGRLEIAGGPEGPTLSFSIGLSTGYGDRQHRE